MRPDEFWGNRDNAAWWVGEDARYRKVGGNETSQYYLRYAVPKSVKTICEVGAGTGRLIRMFKKLEAHSVDINPGLCQYVYQKYPYVKVHNAPAHATGLPDNSMDLVYTFQCLQHVPNDLIMQTLRELLRITKDRLWLIEGYKEDKEQGEMTHPVNGGSFCYYFDKIFQCEEVKILERGIKVYKIRKAGNPTFEVRFGEK